MLSRTHAKAWIMENADIAARLQEALEQAGGLEKSVKFDFGDNQGGNGGSVLAHGKTAEVDSDAEADCTIAVRKADFIALAKGDLDPMMAFMSGKLKVSGDISVALGLQSLFSRM